MRKNILMMMAPRKKQELPYLCFTAEVSNSKVTLNKVGSPALNTIQYSYDGKNWDEYTFGNAIQLINIGDKVYFRNADSFDDSNPRDFTIDDANRYSFSIGSNSRVKASGDVQSLIDRNVVTKIARRFRLLFLNCYGLTTPPKLGAETLMGYAYYRMFDGCTNLNAIPELPATQLISNCYRQMFSGCTNLSSVKLTPTSLNTGVFRSMFSGCTNLSSVEVYFTNWRETMSATLDWLSNVAANGTFVCPAALPTKDITRGPSTIPENWTVKKKGYYSNSKFYDDPELTTESVLTEGEYYIDIPTQDEYYYNGTDLVLWGGQLPDGYEPLDYIETDGNQYIDTQYLGQSPNVEIITKVSCPGTPSAGENIISNYSGSSSNDKIGLGINRYGWFAYSRHGANAADTYSYVDKDLDQMLITSWFNSSLQTKQLIVNGVSGPVVSYTCETSSKGSSYKLMARGDSTNNNIREAFVGQLYYLVLKEDGEVKLHFLPCHYTANNVYGVYDLKRNAFYPLITVTA